MLKPDVIFVHLTDLHVKNADSPGMARASALARAIGALYEVETHLVIIMSGDIAYHGSKGQYEEVNNFLTRLRSELAAWKWSSIAVLACPGNHDNDYALTDEFTRDSLLKQAETLDVDDLRAVNALIGVQKPFVDFRDANHPDYVVHSPLQATAEFDFEGDIVVVDVINSSWSSIMNDKPGRLMMPTSILKAPRGDAAITFAAIHHPPNWYRPGDQRKFVEILDQRYEIVLWGHEHEADEVERIRKRIGATVRFVIGDAFDPPAHESLDPGFRCFQWNRRENDFRDVTFAWDVDHFVRREDNWSGSVPKNNARQAGCMRHTDAYARFLDDPGVAFTHPYVDRPIHLSDIFVYPEFLKIDGTKSIESKIGADFHGADFIEHLLTLPKAIIVGPEQAGKTSFAKMITNAAPRRGKMPLYLDASGLKSANRGEIRAWMKSAQEEQYAVDCIEGLLQMLPEERVVILDNAHLLPAGQEGANQVVEFVSGFATSIIILSSQSPAMAIISNEQLPSRHESYWRGAEMYDLLPLSHVGRSNLIRRWVGLGREGKASNEEIEADVRVHKDALDQVLGRNFLPKFPLFVLILLQQFESFRDSKAVVASGSHGYLFEALIIDSFDKHVRSNSITIVFAYLASLARLLSDREERRISNADQAKFHTSFVGEKLVDVDRDQLLAELVKAQVLIRSADGIGFRYQYLYYYFLARSYADTKETEETQSRLQRLVDFVHTEESSNVLTFLAHLGGEADVLPKLLSRAREVFQDAAPVKIEDFSGLLQRFRTVNDRAVLLEGDARELSDHHDRAQDRIESERPRDDLADSSQEDLLQFNTSFKLLQVLGQVLRSQAGRIGGARLVEIAECCLALSRRTLGSLYVLIQKSPENLVHEASDMFEQQLSVDKTRALDIANRFLAFVVVSMAIVTTAKTGEAIGSAELVPVIEALEKASPDLTQRLLLVAARLNGERDFAAHAVRKLVKDLGPNKVLPLMVLSEIVTRRFFLHPPDRHTKQAFCELLNIETRKLTLSQIAR